MTRKTSQAPEKGADATRSGDAVGGDPRLREIFADAGAEALARDRVRQREAEVSGENAADDADAAPPEMDRRHRDSQHDRPQENLTRHDDIGRRAPGDESRQRDCNGGGPDDPFDNIPV